MATIKINNKHYQEYEIVLLDSDHTGLIGKYYDTNRLVLRTPYDIPRGTNMSLYIISNDDIKQNNWIYNINTREIIQCIGKGSLRDWRKIIATNDYNLRIEEDTKLINRSGETIGIYPMLKVLPKIPESFIEDYVTEYNKGNVISKVMVEVDLHGVKFEIKLNQLDKISILTEQKQTFSFDTNELLLKIFMQGFNDELNGKNAEESIIKAYQLGREHAFIGDEVTSVDYLSNDEILSRILS